MPSNTELQNQLTAMTTRATKAEGRAETLTADLAAANEKAAQEKKSRQDAEKALDTARGEINDLTNSLRAYKGSATKAREEATILKGQLSPQVRPIGALKQAKTDEERSARVEALEAAFAMGPTTIVCSDGRREIREIAPLIVDGNAWLQRPNFREFDFDPILEPNGERQQVELAGFGLLNAAGDQVGYCPLPTPLPINRGQKMRIPKGVIHF